jgi:hypothetical protein
VGLFKGKYVGDRNKKNDGNKKKVPWMMILTFYTNEPIPEKTNVMYAEFMSTAKCQH